MTAPKSQTHCIGCGALLDDIDGPTHKYMSSSPACFAEFTKILAFEYSEPDLLQTHRLSVDTYAIQHPGSGKQRKEIQSVGLHLARLMLQLDRPRTPSETNDVMLGLGEHKASLVFLRPPEKFSMTVGDVTDYAGTPQHSERVTEWASSTWADWSAHHDYIRHWVEKIDAQLGSQRKS